ncbi:hypothetical protein TWF718_005651 [Orbilia javanica]|uniref:Uncharacterized protein n=1 Tax=Orbilia javanica TaxID=47235 RepID=A0AAN8MZA5_9PEZI
MSSYSLSSKIILITIFLLPLASTASTTKPGTKTPKIKNDIISSPYSKNGDINITTTKITLPPFVDVSDSEPNASSKPGLRPIGVENGDDVDDNNGGAGG